MPLENNVTPVTRWGNQCDKPEIKSHNVHTARLLQQTSFPLQILYLQYFKICTAIYQNI